MGFIIYVLIKIHLEYFSSIILYYHYLLPKINIMNSVAANYLLNIYKNLKSSIDFE